jgi:hypothetical protein
MVKLNLLSGQICAGHNKSRPFFVKVTNNSLMQMQPNLYFHYQIVVR